MSFFCLQCGMDMHKPGRICPYCKAVQYEEPSAANMAMAANISGSLTVEYQEKYLQVL